MDFLVNMDEKAFLFLNRLHSPFWDEVMFHFSGKAEWVPLYLFILGWLVYRFRWKSIPVLLAIVLLITASDQLSVILFKNTVQRLRPCHDPGIVHMVHLVRDHCGGMYGFVSNHAANTFALAVLTSLVFRKRLYTLLILVWALVVSYSRIYLGVHYPGDVIGGALFGSVLAVLFYHLYVRAKRVKLLNG